MEDLTQPCSQRVTQWRDVVDHLPELQWSGGECRWTSSKMLSRWYEAHICSYHSLKLSNANFWPNKNICDHHKLPSQCCNTTWADHQNINLFVCFPTAWSKDSSTGALPCCEVPWAAKKKSRNLELHTLEMALSITIGPCNPLAFWRWGSMLCNLRWVVASRLKETPARQSWQHHWEFPELELWMTSCNCIQASIASASFLARSRSWTNIH